MADLSQVQPDEVQAGMDDYASLRDGRLAEIVRDDPRIPNTEEAGI